MSTFSSKCGFAIIMTALGLSCPAAHAQSEPVRYWIPFGPFGFGGAAETTSTPSYSSFPAFSAADPEKNGFVFRSYSAPVDALTGGFGPAAFSSLDSLSYESTQFGYNFKGVGNLPMTVFGGVDTLKYNPDVFSAITSFSPNTDTAPAYGVHGGVEIRPSSNVSLSFSAGFTQQQPSFANTDISSSLLPRQLGGQR
ncbi:MAG TPA: hypothetical protein VHC94_05235 [Nitrobacter sp.]|jgi:hypothetical protein|nr:hypothetical protein [Nitrobacter sp.]